MQKSLVHIQPSLVADDQSAELVQPCQRAFNHPPVLAQLLAALHSPTCKPGSNAALPQLMPASLEVVSLVSMQLGRSLPSSPAYDHCLLDRLNGSDHISESVTVMHIGRGADYRER